MRPRLAAIGCAVGVALAWGPLAGAAPTAADLETARALYKEGKELRAAGHLTEALEKLKAAHVLGQTPLTGIELARTYVMLAQLIEAREVALGVARIPVASDETERSAEARKDATELAEELRARIPSVTIQVTGVSAGSRPAVLVDGDRLPPEMLGQPRKVDPGPHTIVVGRDDDRGTLWQGVVRVDEREVRVVTVAYPASDPRPPAVRPPALVPAAAPDGFVFGASFLLSPHLYFPATNDPPSYKSVVEVMAGVGVEVGAALTPTFEIMAHGFASIGDRGKPSYALGAGPAFSYRALDRLWLGAGVFAGRADTTFEGVAYSTDLVIGTTIEASYVALETHEGQWLLSAAPGYFYANGRVDNPDFFINFGFGYRSF